jgi:cell division protein FtsI/penicillin-binding protein 2
VIGSARFASASLFKLVTSAALLELGQVPLDTEVCYRGGQRCIERRHLDPPRAPDHCSTLRDALGHSRNAVFAQLATRALSRGDLVGMAARLGFERRVPFDQPVLVGSVSIPYDDLGFARTAAGFGRSTLSPLGAAWLAAIVASGGQAPRLRIVERAGEYEAPPGRASAGRVLRPATAHALTRMMEVTVQSGTSRDVFFDEDGRPLLGRIRVAGKTGTLQPAASEPTTSWFVGFAPSRRPAVVVAAMLQNGRVWRQKANEVARDLLRAHFARRGFRGVTDPTASTTQRLSSSNSSLSMR